MNWVNYIIALTIGSILLGYLFRKDKEPNYHHSDTGYELRLVKKYRRIGLFSVLLSLFLLTIGLIENLPNVWIQTVLLSVIFGIPGLCFVLLYKNYIVRFDNEKIEVHNFWRREKIVYFNDITDVKYYKNRTWVLVYTHDDKIKIHQGTSGLDVLMKKINKKTHLNIHNIDQSKWI